MSNNQKQKLNPVINYSENFIPYRDGNKILWALYDAEYGPLGNGTNLLSEAIAEQTNENHIQKEDLDNLAKEFKANMIFESNDFEAVEKLQDFLGDKINVDDFLSDFGFKKNSQHEFYISESNSDDISINKSEISFKKNNEEIPETSNDFNVAGSVPIDEHQYWDKNDAAKLLKNALVFKHLEAQENIKGSLKETISDLLVVYTAMTATTTSSVISTASGAIAVGLMAHTAYKENIDRNSMLIIWANLHNNIEDPAISRKESYNILKQEMHDSGMLFEGIPKVAAEEYRTRYKEFKQLAKDKGYLTQPITEKAILKVSERIRNTSKSIAKKIGKNIVQSTKLVGQAGKECITDLNLTNKLTREKLWRGLSKGFTITTTDLKNTKKHRKKHKNERLKIVYNEEALTKIKKNPAIINSDLSTDEIRQHIDVLEEIPGINKDKSLAKFNYANVFASMSAQIYSVAIAAAKGDIGEVLYNSYGIVMGIGAMAQVGDNVLNINEKLHSKRADEAQSHEHFEKMKERLEVNYHVQNHENKFKL